MLYSLNPQDLPAPLKVTLGFYHSIMTSTIEKIQVHLQSIGMDDSYLEKHTNIESMQQDNKSSSTLKYQTIMENRPSNVMAKNIGQQWLEQLTNITPKKAVPHALSSLIDMSNSASSMSNIDSQVVSTHEALLDQMSVDKIDYAPLSTLDPLLSTTTQINKGIDFPSLSSNDDFDTSNLSSSRRKRKKVNKKKKKKKISKLLLLDGSSSTPGGIFDFDDDDDEDDGPNDLNAEIDVDSILNSINQEETAREELLNSQPSSTTSDISLSSESVIDDSQQTSTVSLATFEQSQLPQQSDSDSGSELGSELDDSDPESDEDTPASSTLICLWTTRRFSKERVSFELKNGILTFDGHDYVFSRCRATLLFL